jgi:AraC-like DNA-binding protein
MLYREHRPSPPLSRFVTCLWYCEDYSAPHAFEKVLPNGSVQIVINLDRPAITNYEWQSGRLVEIQRQPILITGLQTKAMFVDTRDMRRLIGVLFAPGGAPAILGIPAHELTNLDVEMNSGSLRDQLLEAVNPFLVLEAWLSAKLGQGLSSHPAIDWSLRNIRLPLSEILRHTSLSDRRFREVFRAQVGVPPKLYQRIQRFRAAVNIASETAEPNWTRLAQDCGYFDQAHFVHDFKAFSGFTPSQYPQRKLHWAGHVSADFYKKLSSESSMLIEA